MIDKIIAWYMTICLLFKCNFNAAKMMESIKEKHRKDRIKLLKKLKEKYRYGA